MKDWTPRIVILVLLAVILGVPFALRPSDASRGGSIANKQAGDDLNRLIILSPHNETIRFEISQGFNKWRVAQKKPPIEFDWRSSGGASDLGRQIRAEFE